MCKSNVKKCNTIKTATKFMIINEQHKHKFIESSHVVYHPLRILRIYISLKTKRIFNAF